MGFRTIGLRLESLDQPIRQAIATAAGLGVSAVQLDAAGELSPAALSQTGRRAVRRLVASHGLSMSAIAFPTRQGYDALDRLEGRVAATLEALRLAAELSAPMVVNHIGNIPADGQDKANAHFFDSLDAIGREADRVGVQFAIATGADSPQSLADFLRNQNTNGLAVQFDPANLMVRGFNAYDAALVLAGSIVGICVKDAVRTGMALSGSLEAPLGDGELDWRRLLALIDEIDYRGVFTVMRDGGSQRIADIRKAIEFLKAH